jgi:aspartyl protease family protein
MRETTLRRLPWLLIAVIAVSLLLLSAQPDHGVVGGLARADLPSLGIKIVLLVLVGGLALVLFRERFAEAIRSALLWVAIALVLVVGYAYRDDVHAVGQRVIAELVPGYVVSEGQTVMISQSGEGHFAIRASINGARVSMVLDTGASAVVLTQEAARAAGLPIEVLTYSVNVETANGRTRAAPVTLDQLSVGGITERAVTALIAQPGQLHTSLLGMSFLNRLESWQVRGGKLVMRAYP